MWVFNILDKLLLGPLELLFDVIFSIGYQIAESSGIAIILLSISINLLVLPLYRRADIMQEEERAQILKMKPGIDHIKKYFKGDERFMILRTYYRQSNYKPYYALKGSLSLLLEIPFFMAAYRYLSGLNLLQGVSFGPVANLGKPDNLIPLWGGVHLLPILMTVINLISSAIYLKGMTIKSKIQLSGMALVFLVLLYESPAGLVLYWTLNNLFSLAKNILYKTKNPSKIIKAICSITGVVLVLIFCIISPLQGVKKILYVIGFAILLQLPLIIGFLKKVELVRKKEEAETRGQNAIFYSCCLLMSILLGILIPSTVINSSPGEFVEMSDFHSPLRYLLSSGLYAAGFLLVWGVIFYKLSSERAKKGFSLATVVITVVSIINYMFFGKGFGNLSSLLIYDVPISITRADQLINLLVIVTAVGLIYLLWKKKKELLKVISFAGCIAVTIMSMINVTAISGAATELEVLSRQRNDEKPSFKLSQNGKNVVVIMLDRAISGFVPYIFEENNAVAEQFRGFVYYPNTLSYGHSTNTGSPAIFGGYEYTPFEINNRPELSLAEKQNEALKLMPVLFVSQGFDVTVCDPPYANYQWIPDLSIYNDYPQIHKYITHGAFDQDEQELIDNKERTINRNLFCYSIFRAVPAIMQNEIYDNGKYNEARVETPDEMAIYNFTIESETRSTGVLNEFLKAYRVLQNLPFMTTITNDEENTFLMLENGTTHDVTMLQEPEFAPKNIVDNTAYENEHRVRFSTSGEVLELKTAIQMEHYQSNMAAFIQLGKWFDYLRENNVWDNTRIIIVSDHGRHIQLTHYFFQGAEENDDELREYEDIMCYNALLMVKDFNNDEFIQDDSFMTCADTPSIAIKQLIDQPINPFTGNEINSLPKDADPQYVMYTEWNISLNNGNVFSNPIRLTVNNHFIFDYANWDIPR